MPWVRLDDAFSSDPKVVCAGPLGMALEVAALCYANRHLTDGFVPRAIVPILLNFEELAWVPEGGLAGPVHSVTWELVVNDLVNAGLWTCDEEAGGYRILNFHKYQPSRAEVLDKRAKTAGRVAAWKQRHAAANRTGNGIANTGGNSVSNGVDTPAPGPGPGPDPVSGSESEKTPEYAPRVSRSAPRREAAKPPATPPQSLIGRWFAEHWPDIRDPDALGKSLHDAFPTLDLVEQAKRALAWEHANPERAKKRHAPFFQKWLTRSQDGSPGGRLALTPPTTSPIYHQRFPTEDT